MTDDKLIQLVQETPPEELSVEEIDLLRRRAAESVELREALAAHLHFEEFLSGSLAREVVSVDSIVLGQSPLNLNGSGGSRRWLWGVAGLALLIAVSTAAFVFSRARQAQPELLAKVSPPATVAEAKPSTQNAPTTAAATGTNKPAEQLAKLELPKQVEPPVVDKPSVPFEQVCFQDLPPPATDAEMTQLKAWWQAAEGSAKASATTKNKITSLSMSGLFKLAVPWRARNALRISWVDISAAQLHIWHGQTGISLQYSEKPWPTWIAYRATRKAGAQEPDELALAACDNDRYRRTGNGTIELRYQDGQLVLSRGDVLLLTAPLDGAPDAVFLDVDAKSLLAGVAMVPSERFPLSKESDNQASPLDMPARLAWQTTLPSGAKLLPQPDGSVELQTQDNSTAAWIMLPIVDPGLQEVIFQLEDPTAGSGVFVADSTGRPLRGIGFAEQRKGKKRGASKDLLLTVAQPQDRQAESRSENQPLLPLVGQQPWLRIVAGGGALKCWASVDGVHWAQALEPRGLGSGYSRVGLFCAGGKGSRSIKLRSLSTRRLAGIDALADQDLRDKALAVVDAPNAGSWLQTVLEHQPVDVDPLAWQRACAVRTLAAGARGEVPKALTLGLLDALDNDTRPLAKQLESLEDLALVADSYDSLSGLRFVDQYLAIGRKLLRAGQRRPYSQIRKPLMESPLWTATNINTLPASLVRPEILGLIYADAWDELGGVCRRLEFFAGKDLPQRDGRPADVVQTMQLVAWADALVDRNLKQQPGAGATIPTQWRHPLIEQLGKEGYNVLAELEAALAGGAYKDACQIISSVTAQQAVGLLPNTKDPALLVSLPGAVALAMQDYPPLRQTMQTEFGPLGQLRLRQAIGDDDPAAVEALTVQFYSTPAANEAHIWLGDRAMARGDFARAEGHYQTAAAELPETDRGPVAARLRLAAAMTGRDVGSPITEPIQLGDTLLKPAEFERLVTDMKARQPGFAADAAAGTDSSATSAAITLAPRHYQMKRIGAWDGDQGRDPNGSRRDLDVIARQIAFASTAKTLITSNRYAVTAYDPAHGQKLWQVSLGGEQGKASQWPLVPMRPVLSGSRIYVRRLLSAGPELACLDGGQIVWRSDRGVIIASDPLVLPDRLLAVTVSTLAQETLQLSIASFDLASGKITGQQPLAQFRDAWQKELSAELTRVGDTIVVSTGGCVLGCSLEGQPKWLRREMWLSGVLDPRTSQQQYGPPLVGGKFVFAAQPGVPTVECMHLRTGRLIWQYVASDLIGMIGLTEKNLIVRTSQGFMALDRESGKPAWFHDAADTLDGIAFDPKDGLVYARREALGNKLARVRLVWVDPESGGERSHAALDDWQQDQPLLGPLMPSQDRVWAVAGAAGGKQPTRELFELVPAEPAEEPDAPDSLPTGWLASTVSIFGEPGAALAHWALLQTLPDPKSGLRPELNGEHDVFVTRATADRPARWTRLARLPAGGGAKLQIQIAPAENSKSTLEIQAGDRTLRTETIDPAADGGWREIEVDLTEFAGKTVWLFVHQKPSGVGQSYVAWKRMELITP